jgi:AcrR family transcriptional regulator
MSGTRDRILEATGTVLAEHGYAGLSMANVAEEFEGSQSLIHHHFESKAGLLAAFVATERERVRETFADLPDDPDERFDALIDILVGALESGTDDATATVGTYVELDAAARHHEAVADELREMEALIREELVETLDRGIEAGVFADVDSGAVAELVLAANQRAASHRQYSSGPDLTGALETLVLEELHR